MVQIGSWGTPEFGITEKLQSIFAPNKGLSSQGGSNLFGPSQPSASTPTAPTSTSPYGPTYYGPQPAPKPSGTLSSGGKTLGASTYQDPYAGANNAAQSEADAYLQSLNTEYDRAAEDLRGQLTSAGNARTQGLSSLQSAVDEYGNTINTQKQTAQNATAKNIQSAGSMAAQTQGKSRNILRALGILSSSAAGDILSRPMSEFGTQKADLQQGLIQRTQELDNALAQKTSEHANLVKQLESQYADIVGKIQTDLRFSDRERADAVATAKAAVLSRLSEIRTAQANWQNQINAAKSGLASSTAGFSSYAQPTADLSKISGTGLNPQEQYKQGQQTSVYDPKKRLQADTVSPLYKDTLSSGIYNA
jgi:hypothetical protein